MTPVYLAYRPDLARAVVTVLHASAIRIERDGFAQRKFYDGETNTYCARGAYTQEAITRYGATPIWQEIIDGCELALNMRLSRGVAAWNDQPGRTVDQVVGLLRAVADELRRSIRVAA